MNKYGPTNIDTNKAGIHTATVRFFGAARSAAKVEEERFGIASGMSVSALAAELAQRHGAKLSRVLTRSTYLVDGVAVATSLSH
jgi:molybdopterin converting factor small subunit